MIRVVFALVFLLMFFSISVKTSFAEVITPYGDYCPLCGDYGYCRKQPTKKEVSQALNDYYLKKGLKASITRQFERFVEAEVYRKNFLVDRVLIDIRTGRMRSIY